MKALGKGSIASIVRIGLMIAWYALLWFAAIWVIAVRRDQLWRHPRP